MNSNRIFLIGLMGSGKTYWGRRIADILKWKFIDLDRYIEEREKMNIPGIFEKYGESNFRNLENKYLKELVSMNYIVVATGGGAPCFHGNMELMNRSGETFYLKAKVELSAKRLKSMTEERPLLKGTSPQDLIPLFIKQLKEREPIYLQAAQILDAEKLDEKKLKELFIPRQER